MQLIVIPPPLTDEEREIYRQLEAIKRAYEREAKPYIDRLVAIKCTQLPRYVLMPDSPEVPQ